MRVALKLLLVATWAVMLVSAGIEVGVWLAPRSSTNVQVWRSYKTFTDASNYERFTILPRLAMATETTTLTTPVAKPSQTTCRVDRITLDLTQKSIGVQILGNNDEAISKVYDATTTPTGASLLSALNTANLTTNSFIKRVLTRLATDGICVGTVSGAPE